MGNFKLLLSVLFVALFTCCKKNTVYIDIGGTDTTNNGSGGNNGGGSGGNSGGSQQTTAIYYAKGKLDGVSFLWEVTESDGSFSFGSNASSSLGNGIAIGGVSGTISKIVTPQVIQPAIEVEFRTMKVSYLDDKFTYLKSFIKVSNWEFDQTNTYVVDSKKLWIRYTDKNGKVYLSAIGTQTGSTAAVTYVKEVPAQLGVPASLDVKVRLSCKLYPSNGTGSAVSLTDSEISVNIFNMI